MTYRLRRAWRFAFLALLISTATLSPIVYLGVSLHGGGLDVLIGSVLLVSVTVSPCVAVVAFIVGLTVRVSPDRIARSRLMPDLPEQTAIQKAKESAGMALHTPVYIVEFAKAAGISLDDVHKKVREGELQVVWVDGIAFIDAERSHSAK